MARLQLPLGAIVDAALQRQFESSFPARVQPATLPLPAANDADVAVSVTAMRLDLAFIAPVDASINYTACLELDLRLTDALGRLLVQTTVDSGTWQAAEQAAQVAREALLADRQRERAL